MLVCEPEMGWDFVWEQRKGSLPSSLSLSQKCTQTQTPIQKGRNAEKTWITYCGLGPFCLSRACTLFSSCRLCSSPAFVMHSWWHIKILSTVLSAVTSFSWMDILFVENTAWCLLVWAEMNTEENLSYVLSIRSEINFPVEMSNYSNLSSRQKSFWQSVFLKNPAIQLAWIRWPIRD